MKVLPELVFLENSGSSTAGVVASCKIRRPVAMHPAATEAASSGTAGNGE